MKKVEKIKKRLPLNKKKKNIAEKRERERAVWGKHRGGREKKERKKDE